MAKLFEGQVINPHELFALLENYALMHSQPEIIKFFKETLFKRIQKEKHITSSFKRMIDAGERDGRFYQSIVNKFGFSPTIAGIMKVANPTFIAFLTKQGYNEHSTSKDINQDFQIEMFSPMRWDTKLSELHHWLSDVENTLLRDTAAHPKIKEAAKKIIQNLNSYSLEKAKSASQKWFEVKAHYAEVEVDSGGYKLIAEVGNGRLYELQSQEAYKSEGTFLQNCIGSYYKYNDDKVDYIYVVKDKNNKSHVGIRVRDGVVQEVKGKNNTIVNEKYAPVVTELLNKMIKLKLIHQRDNITYADMFYYLPKSNTFSFGAANILKEIIDADQINLYSRDAFSDIFSIEGEYVPKMDEFLILLNNNKAYMVEIKDNKLKKISHIEVRNVGPNGGIYLRKIPHSIPDEVLMVLWDDTEYDSGEYTYYYTQRFSKIKINGKKASKEQIMLDRKVPNFKNLYHIGKDQELIDLLGTHRTAEINNQLDLYLEYDMFSNIPEDSVEALFDYPQLFYIHNGAVGILPQTFEYANNDIVIWQNSEFPKFLFQNTNLYKEVKATLNAQIGKSFNKLFVNGRWIDFNPRKFNMTIPSSVIYHLMRAFDYYVADGDVSAFGEKKFPGRDVLSSRGLYAETYFDLKNDILIFQDIRRQFDSKTHNNNYIFFSKDLSLYKIAQIIKSNCKDGIYRKDLIRTSNNGIFSQDVIYKINGEVYINDEVLYKLGKHLGSFLYNDTKEPNGLELFDVRKNKKIFSEIFNISLVDFIISNTNTFVAKPAEQATALRNGKLDPQASYWFNILPKLGLAEFSDSQGTILKGSAEHKWLQKIYDNSRLANSQRKKFLNRDYHENGGSNKMMSNLARYGLIKPTVLYHNTTQYEITQDGLKMLRDLETNNKMHIVGYPAFRT